MVEVCGVGWDSTDDISRPELFIEPFAWVWMHVVEIGWVTVAAFVWSVPLPSTVVIYHVGFQARLLIWSTQMILLMPDVCDVNDAVMTPFVLSRRHTDLKLFGYTTGVSHRYTNNFSEIKGNLLEHLLVLKAVLDLSSSSIAFFASMYA